MVRTLLLPLTTAIFWLSLILFFLLFSGFFAIVGIVTGRIRQTLLLASHYWAKSLLLVNGVRVSVVGLDKVDWSRQYIFASNHQSVIDILVLAAVIPVPFVFVVKKTLFRVPLFGTFMKAAGYLSMDRKNPKKDYREIKNVLDRTDVNLLIFPEGSRSRSGELLPFKSGVTKIAELSKRQIVPIAVSASRRIMQPGKKWCRPGRVHVTFSEPMSWTGKKKPFLDQLRAQIARVDLQTVPQAS